jgi:hypothetical protein
MQGPQFVAEIHSGALSARILAETLGLQPKARD